MNGGGRSVSGAGGNWFLRLAVSRISATPVIKMFSYEREPGAE